MKRMPKHGTNTRYTKYECRCAKCRKAANKQHYEYRRKLGVVGLGCGGVDFPRWDQEDIDLLLSQVTT